MATRKKGATAPPKVRCANTLGLAKWRQSKGVSLEDIAEKTKISLHFLKAIEAEEFSKLPGGIFNTSYLRQYASAIAFDVDCLLAYYHRSQSPQVASPAAAPSPERPQRSFVVRWLGISPQTQH